jgi:hypothetical protein
MHVGALFTVPVMVQGRLCSAQSASVRTDHALIISTQFEGTTYQHPTWDKVIWVIIRTSDDT